MPTRNLLEPTAGVNAGGSGGEIFSGSAIFCADAPESSEIILEATEGTIPPVTRRAVPMATVIAEGRVIVLSRAQRETRVGSGRTLASLI